ncbi:MAG TPA: protein kinase [Candidatus Sulfotelmatobacter sp.]|nr:protein kinase [Candidatus Sulfotelmatobacter sp.]
MALSIGTKLGPYEILSALGAGGMGEVYRARDTRLERTVAIKILPAHLSSSSELKARFEREARAVSSLNHPHICHLYDVGLQDDTSYLVMEYLEGESLAERLRKGPLPLKQVLQFGIQIADALTNAHRMGLLHRDLKPANVMLTAGGAKLLDFGLAKTAPAVSGSALAAISSMTPSTPTMTLAELSSPSKGLTQRGTVVGTFQYMAPEVLQGREADARSDIFSLGCVLYEMATGHRAFEGKSQLSVLTSILEKDPEPVSQLQPTSPSALDHLVKACLEKNPDERLQTAHDVKVQLKWITEGDSQVGIRPSVRGSRLPWLVAGLAILLMIALIAGYLILPARPAPVVRSFILPPPGNSFITFAPSSGPPEISPDGTRLTFTARDDKGKVMLYVRSLSALAADPLPGTEDASYPFWSPDSREIGFFAGGKLKKIDASGGPPQNLCDVAVGRGGTWSKDGVIIFSPGATQSLLQVSAEGGTTGLASKFDLSRGDNSHRWPHFLPDGRHFLFWARSSHGMQEHQVYVGTLGSLEVKPLMKSRLPAFYTPGYLLFLRDQTLMAQPFNPRTLELSGAPTPIAEHVAVNSTTSRPIFSASNDHSIVYQIGSEQGGWQLLWLTRDGKQVGTLGDLAPYGDPAISPDGTRVAVAVFTGQGSSDIWIFDSRRAAKTRLTFGTAILRYPVWTPDGKTIYYGSNVRGAYHIYAKAADGTGSEQVILEDDAFDYPWDISSDGKYLAYMRPAADGKGGTEIWALPLSADRKPFSVLSSSFTNYSTAISPDGKWMAYSSTESGRFEVYVTAFPGGGAKWEVSVNGGSMPKWRHDGKELFFLDPADNLMAVDVSTTGKTIQTGTPHPLFRPLGLQGQLGPYAVTADGKKFLINGGNVKEENQPFVLVQNWTAQINK